MLENQFLIHKKHAKVGIDATASSLQMIGIFLNDEKLLKQTKFLESDENNDTYEIFRKNIENSIIIMDCFRIRITLKHAISVLMTYAYNQGVHGLSKNFYGAFGILSYKASWELANIMEDILRDAYPYLT